MVVEEGSECEGQAACGDNEGTEVEDVYDLYMKVGNGKVKWQDCC